MTLLIAGDIGGTKTILRLVEVTKQAVDFQTVHQVTYPSQNYSDLVPMVQEFLGETDYTPTKACFAIAGPVIQQSCQLTNLSWYLEADRLQQELNLEAVSLINDFAAVSYGVLGIKNEELEPLQGVTPQKDAPIAIIGAGTGLGEGFLIPKGNGDYQIFGTEGGHTDFAARSELEFQILNYIRQQKQVSRVSVERIVSGQGIISIYQALRDLNIHPEGNASVAETIREWEKQQRTEIDPAAAIAQAAATDRLCEKTMELFMEAYAAEAGNLALKLLPYGGLYIAGGIAAKNLAWMKSNRFLKVFKDKGRVSPVLDAVPIHLILDPQVGLIGSIMYGLNQ
ncbi:glucokinase [Halothece sp. PCC 7418]|uniref:glucokinase n=1 Tax=Halothece sp. (strain PCC 7418) TaxID=65093 RepID=UPI0002A06014|nr:glucokinase [Halothece sp. PCC 7418]AFZ42723.1 glucokinase [Halothece sp. PCC 7418]